MLCVFHTPPLTEAANQEPSGCGTTLSMADDDVMAVASELVEEKNKKGRGERSQTCGINVGCRSVERPAAGAAGKKVVGALVARRRPRRHDGSEQHKHGETDNSRHDENEKCCKNARMLSYADACSI